MNPRYLPAFAAAGLMAIVLVPALHSAPATQPDAPAGELRQRQLDDQVLRLIRDQHVPELASLASLPPDDRDMLATLLDGLNSFRNGRR